MAKSLEEISVQTLYKGSLGEIYVRDLLAISTDLYAISSYKMLIRGLPARSPVTWSLGKISASLSDWFCCGAVLILRLLA